MSDTSQWVQLPGRNMTVTVSADTMAALEMAALDEARQFYGDGWRLWVMPEYRAWPNHDPKRTGKFVATVTVRLVEDSP
jgi:hypothetical protein